MRQQFCGDAGRFYEGLAVIELNGKWFHVLESGQPAYSERYKMAEYFQDGLAWVQKKDGAWVRINKQGRQVNMKAGSTSL